MQLKFNSAHKSIARFGPVNLPDFAIFTGLNGSGKTHLLQAINNGNCTIGNIPANRVKYYSLTDFKVAESGALNGQQITQQQTAAWQVLNGKPNWIQTSSAYFKSSFVVNVDGANIDHSAELDFDSLNLWDLDPKLANEKQIECIKNYITMLENNIFFHANFSAQAQNKGIVKAIKKIGKPLHLVTAQEFNDCFVPSTSKDNHLSISIGSIFTKYKTAYFQFMHNEFEKLMKNPATTQVDTTELKEKFEQKNPKPWDIFNEVLQQIHLAAGGDLVFDFAITDPNEVQLQIANWQSYTFIPQLKDRKTGQPRSFADLSSGEKFLLALAVSIYEAQDGYDFPKVLLLDEVDATLHPSMIKSLIDTLQTTFVEKGTKVILATHSPSTVAIAPQGAVFVVNKGSVANKVETISNEDALKLVTQGYATLNDGLSIFDQISDSEVCIITEGKNSNVIEKACAFFEEPDVKVLSCFQGNTGKSQLKTLYQFFERVPHSTKVLFVWDCDVSYSLTEGNNTYPFILAQNAANNIATDGIENMFPESVFDNFVITSVDSRGNTIKSFDKQSKPDFDKFIVENGTIENYANFKAVIDEIQRIKASTPEAS